MNEQMLIGISIIFVLGIFAQWISWRFAFPSILLLLIFGFIAGPVTGILNPDKIFGDVLFPLVSISVAIILFEGGANLKIKEIKNVKGVVRNLVTTGILITWILSSITAYFILGLSINMALLLGAILVVTGPTVILPLLKHVRPKGQINPVLRWEGIVNDPIGALLAILVFEAIIAGGIEEATILVLSSIFKTILFSSSVGVAGAFLMIFFLKKKIFPEFLQNSMSIALVVFVFTVANVIQKESGLFSVTIMGIILANQKSVAVQHIIEFKEILRTILLAFLFIVLSARIELESFNSIGWESLLFIALLIIIIRPAAVIMSAGRSSLSRKELIYLSFMAPRGVVAAAVASLFAIELINVGQQEAEVLVPLMFIVIVSTITVYGLSAMPIAKLLNLADADPQGLLILGAHPAARMLAKAAQAEGFKVLLVDSNHDNVQSAKMENLPVHFGSILAEGVQNELDLTGIGKLLALTQNKEVNSLAVLYYSKIFGIENVYQIKVSRNIKDQKEVTSELRGRVLFNANINVNDLLDDISEKITKATVFSPVFSYEDLMAKHSNKYFTPLFLITENKRLIVYSDDDNPVPKAGQTLISLLGKEN